VEGRKEGGGSRARKSKVKDVERRKEKGQEGGEEERGGIGREKEVERERMKEKEKEGRERDVRRKSQIEGKRSRKTAKWRPCGEQTILLRRAASGCSTAIQRSGQIPRLFILGLNAQNPLRWRLTNSSARTRFSGGRGGDT
jgi:hypothetical protein